MMFLTTVFLLGATLMCVNAEVTCGTNAKESTREHDSVQYECSTPYVYGSNFPDLVWLDKNNKEVPNIPVQQYNNRTRLVTRNFYIKAKAPEVEPLTCVDRNSDSNPQRQQWCKTEKVEFPYSVRDVTTSLLWYASPGEEIECKAKGEPEPTFGWQWRETEGNWYWYAWGTDKIELPEFDNTTASLMFRCVARNKVDRIDYYAESAAVTVSKDGTKKRTIIIATVCVVIGVVVIIGVIVYCVKKNN